MDKCCSEVKTKKKKAKLCKAKQNTTVHLLSVLEYEVFLGQTQMPRISKIERLQAAGEGKV